MGLHPFLPTGRDRRRSRKEKDSKRKLGIVDVSAPSGMRASNRLEVKSKNVSPRTLFGAIDSEVSTICAAQRSLRPPRTSDVKLRTNHFGGVRTMFCHVLVGSFSSTNQRTCVPAVQAIYEFG